MSITRRTLLCGSLGAAAAVVVAPKVGAIQAGLDFAVGPSTTTFGVFGVNGRRLVHINNLIMISDLRGEDPDRAMMAWVEPIERLARAPGGSQI